MPTSQTALTAARATVGHHVPAPRAEVPAAGVLPWRTGPSGLEVMVIHRPRYDDWSWPKGKLDPGETLPECAVREVREETGLRVALGIPLAVTRYEVKNRGGKPGTRPKEVWYWAAEAGRQKGQADGDEVDELRWVSPAAARRLLTNATDRQPLDALEAAYGERRLRTVPLVLLRHAKAKPRSSWSRAEEDRPLAATGRRQALADRRLLTAWAPEKLFSSPWRRCVETLAPLVKDTRLPVKYKASLTEAGAKDNPKKTRRVMRGLLEKRRALVVCSHRPVLPELLQEIEAITAHPDVLKALPAEDPYLRPGGVLVAHQGLNQGGRVVALECYDPADG
ncbi:NUDIX hydrolase [Micrococcus lylae]|uniref:NUDIX hydrolase n=1 Tax=Micrococcus lylae TaxID=1273 RepID=UPI0021A5CC9D|nr:NUDIX hydrolase [Micrococcus lylae]MCT2008347.1 NUDIX hydrolase [Micrococcus lylae]MCT2072263.1 NUDIX hydrolase [Micrococcus lylae]